MSELRDFITVKKVADAFNVCPSTIRNWERAGKIKGIRHPMNGYRLYHVDEIKRVLKKFKPNRFDDV